MSAPLLDSVVLSDATLTRQATSVNVASSKLSLIWATPSMAMHVGLSTALAAVVYISHSSLGYPLSTGAFLTGHTLLGTVLGILLSARVILGLSRVAAAAKAVQTFSKVCRQLAVLSTFVGETLTVSAGAEMEAKATSKFRYELVRLLNLSFYSFQMMLEGMKLCVAPTSLKPKEGGVLEMEQLSAGQNPTVMVCKMIASLVEQQRAAKRISNEQVAVVMEKISELVDAYHEALALVLAPVPSSLGSLTFFFTALFAYTLGPIIAFNELGDNLEFGSLGLGLTVFYTAMLSLFYFGLYEAGKTVEAPLAELSSLLSTSEMGYALSTDLANLVDDAEVPIMLSQKS